MADSNTGQACRGLSWTIDAWGNRTDQTVTAGTCYTFHQAVDGNNRLLGAPYQYDSAGNMINDASHAYAFDAENHVTQVDGGSTASYVYDADGRRVWKSSGGSTIDYLYDLSGNIFAEFGPGCGGTGCWVAGAIYLNGQFFAEYYNSTTYFVHPDHLGSSRLLTGLDQSLCDNLDYLPYGEQISGGSCTNLRFTGKERDSESGLDNFGARYDSSSMGRFMSADPMGGHLEDPQTLNRYSYVRNNPLNLTDPTGLDFYLQCTDEKHSGCTQVQIDPNNKNKTWVQADQNGNATIITSDSIRAGDNTAMVNENGVTINGNSQGIYFDNAASHTTDANGNDVNHNPIDLAGSGALRDFSFTINGNCSGSCLSSGTWSYPGSLEDARDTLYSRHSFSFPGEDEKSDLGYGAHPYSTQHRFGASTCPFFSCTNSPHISVPNSWVPVPKDTVPQGFHVDAHGDFYGHRQDVKRQGVE